MGQVKSFLKGAFFGALVGAVAALLVAPDSGEALKSKAAQRIQGFRSELENAYDARKAQLESELERLRSS